MEKLRNFDVKKAIYKTAAATMLATGIAFATAGVAESESPKPDAATESTFVSEYNSFDSGISPIVYGVGVIMVGVFIGGVLIAASADSAQVPQRKR